MQKRETDIPSRPTSSGGNEQIGSQSLVEQIRGLPTDTLSRMRILTPAVGCPNRCSFCSVGAGTTMFRLTEKGLHDVFSAIKEVTSADRDGKNDGQPLVSAGRTESTPGIIQAYYDNDIGSYPYTDQYLAQASDLNVKTDLASVGWSRHNTELQQMHERINTDLLDSISRIRFSWTPYTYGLTKAAERTGRFSRDDMIADYANMLATYRPHVERFGIGQDRSHAEVRFRPLAESFDHELTDEFIYGHHVIQTGPYLLVSKDRTDQPPLTANIKTVKNGRAEFTEDPTSYVMVQSDQLVAENTWNQTAKRVIADLSVETNDELTIDLGENALVKNVKLYSWENADGPYYAVDPGFQEGTDECNQKQFYPKTEKRRKSGYVDSQRYSLNALLAHQRKQGITLGEDFTDATWEDVAGVVGLMQDKSTELSKYNKRAANYVASDVIPHVDGYAKALQLASYSPFFFFSKDFSIDTGSIFNQGRALHEFHGLASTIDAPMSPWEDRYFGNNSIKVSANTFWKWSPNPFSDGRVLRTAEIGMKHGGLDRRPSSMTVANLHTRTFDSTEPDGTPLPQHVIYGVEVEAITLDKSIKSYLQPGLIKLPEGGVVYAS